MDLLIKNATIIPMTERNLVLHGSIGIEHGKIACIIEHDSVCADNVIDASSMLALPALVNAHTHLSMTFFRNWQDNVRHLQDWLSKIWPIENTLRYEDVKIGSRLGLAESILAGSVCFADMYFFAAATAEEVLSTKVKANIGLTLFGDIESTKQRIAENQGPLEAIARKSHNMISIDIAPHAIYTCSEATYRYAADFAKDHGYRLHTHASETRKEVDDCVAQHGCSPIEYLDRLGFLTSDTYLAHCVHIDEKDIDLICERGAHVIHNPSSNCKLASGAAPIGKLLASGAHVGLGTDGASSNNTLDMFKEMRLAKMINSLTAMNPRSIEPYDVVRMATIGSAEALGRGASCGTIEVGKDADIILIDIDKPHITPLHDPFSALVFAINSSDVDTTICNGNILMDHRVLTTIDVPKAIADVRADWHDIITRQ